MSPTQVFLCPACGYTWYTDTGRSACKSCEDLWGETVWGDPVDGLDPQ